VKDAAAAFPVADVRVEQGRSQQGHLIDVQGDPKFHLTTDVEDLFTQALPLAAAAKPARKKARPPKRSYRQGEI
jgi:hypothetical protein